MPVTDRSKAKEGGFGQIREALQKFEGDVVASAMLGGQEQNTEFGKWGGKLVDDEGKPIPPREYFQVVSTNINVLEVTEELSMDISEGFTFRENCSDFKGSFWIDKFLESADRFKVLIPDGLFGKRVTWEKVTLEAKDKDGKPNPKYNKTGWVIAGVKAIGAASPKVVKKAQPQVQAQTARQILETSQPVEEAEEAPAPVATDEMGNYLKFAIGKTEAKFRTAVGLATEFSASPLLPLAKAGMITQALVNEKKLVLDAKGVYQLPS